MKWFTVTVFLALLAIQAYAWEEADEICVDKLNLDKSRIKPLTAKLLHDEDNEDYNKYSECYWDEYKLLNENKDIKWDAVKVLFGDITFIDNDTMESLIKECQEKDLLGKDVGQTIVKVQNCLMNAGIAKKVIDADD